VSEPARAPSLLASPQDEFHLLDTLPPATGASLGSVSTPGMDGTRGVHLAPVRQAPAGHLYYADAVVGTEFDSRTLAHLGVVIFAKLRRGESFAFSWRLDDGTGARSSIWLNPAIPLRFEFGDSPVPVLNRLWVEALMVTANGPGGLTITVEPKAEPNRV
jgi:hypothetical protein